MTKFHTNKSLKESDGPETKYFKRSIIVFNTLEIIVYLSMALPLGRLTSLQCSASASLCFMRELIFTLLFHNHSNRQENRAFFAFYEKCILDLKGRFQSRPGVSTSKRLVTTETEADSTSALCLRLGQYDIFFLNY